MHLLFIVFKLLCYQYAGENIKQEPVDHMYYFIAWHTANRECCAM